MMSSSGFLLSLDIDRCACRRVSALVLCGTVLALVAVSLSGLAWQPRTLVATVTLACGLWEFRRAWPGSAGHVSRIQVSAEGQFLLGRAGGEQQALAPATLVHWWLLPGLAVGLAFVGTAGQRGQAILFRDQVPPDVWRRFQVRLRHGGDPFSGPLSGPVGV